MENNTLTQTPARALFSPGRIMITVGASAELLERYLEDELKDTANVFLSRHLGGDWNQMSDHDAEANRTATKTGTRVFSSFRLQLMADKGPQDLWIITEADRSSTTILLPSEY